MFGWMLRRLVQRFGSPSSVPVDPGTMTIFDVPATRLLAVPSGRRVFDVSSGSRVFPLSAGPVFTLSAGDRLFNVPRRGEPC